MRLFEAGAVGAAVLSDHWPGIEELFEPGREILLPSGTEEVVEILTTTHEDDRRAIGAAFRGRVLREHTCQHRARELEAYLLAPVAPAGAL